MISSIGIIFAGLVIILAFVDIRSLKSDKHKDMRLSIVMLGILALLFNILFSFIFLDFNTFDFRYFRDEIEFGLYIIISSLIIVIVINICREFSKKGNFHHEHIVSANSDISSNDLMDIKNHSSNINSILVEIKDSLNVILESNAKMASNMSELHTTNFSMLRDTISSNSQSILESSRLNFDSSSEYNGRVLELLRDANVNLKNIIDNLDSHFLNISNDSKEGIQTIKNSNDTMDNNICNHINSLSLTLETKIATLIDIMNNSLEKSISSLSSNFISTINFYFSDNFKRFNQGVDNMLSLQENYNNVLPEINDIMQKQSQHLERLNSITSSILSRDESMVSLCADISNIMNAYKKENENLSLQLTAIGDLGATAAKGMKAVSAFFKDLNNHIKLSNESLIANTKSVIDNVFVGVIKDFETQSKNLTNVINNRNSSIIKSLESSISQLDSFGSKMQKNLESLIDTIDSTNYLILQNSKDIHNNINNIASNANKALFDINNQGMQQLKHTSKSYFDEIISLLDVTMNNISTRLHDNQKIVDDTLNNSMNKYLSFMDKLISSNVNFHREFSKSSINDIKSISIEVSSCIKESSSLLNKSNIELINIVKFLQNELKSASDANNVLQSQTRELMLDIQTSLHQSSESFKNDYEWFLRRVREIIGQRL